MLKRCSGVFALLIARLTNRRSIFGTVQTGADNTATEKDWVGRRRSSQLSADIELKHDIQTLIMERLALARLCRQVTQSENFNKVQSAYRQNHSTETALLNIA